VSELPAAVGLAMAERLGDHIERRSAAADRLVAAALESGAPLEAPSAPGRPPWQGVPLLLGDRALRDRVLGHLRAAGVEARPYYSPGLHRTAAFSRYAAGRLPVTEDLADRMPCLPVYADFTDDELDELTSAVHDSFTAARGVRRSAAR
jgi:dTDP-4-amino-4,6-dideoxygalactose transaminase